MKNQTIYNRKQANIMTKSFDQKKLKTNNNFGNVITGSNKTILTHHD